MTMKHSHSITVLGFPSVKSNRFKAADANAAHARVGFIHPLDDIAGLRPEQQMFALEHKIADTHGLRTGDMQGAIAAKPAIANHLVGLYQQLGIAPSQSTARASVMGFLERCAALPAGLASRDLPLTEQFLGWKSAVAKLELPKPDRARWG